MLDREISDNKVRRNIKLHKKYNGYIGGYRVTRLNMYLIEYKYRVDIKDSDVKYKLAQFDLTESELIQVRDSINDMLTANKKNKKI